MATSITSNFVGKEAGKYVSASLFSGKTLAEENITILPNIQYKANLQVASLTGTWFNDAQCEFNDSGTYTQVERVLTTKDIAINLTLCKKDWISSWEGASMRSRLAGDLPASLTDFILKYVAENVGQQVESNIWAGDSANTGEWDGFQILESYTAYGTDVTTPELMVTGLTELVEDGVTDGMYGHEDLTIFMSTGALKYYLDRMGTLGYANQYYASDVPLQFNGIKIAHAPGQGSDDASEKYRISVSRKSNLFFGTTILSDLNEVRLIDMADVDGSDSFHVVMRMTAGCQIGVLADFLGLKNA